MLSKKAQYAIRAAAYLASHYQRGPVGIAEISEKKRIPLKFLENILLELKKAEILESKKGKGGGYQLKSPPESIFLAKIIRTVDGPIALLPCVSLYFHETCGDCDEQHCRINKVFAEARDATLAVLEHRSLADIAQGVDL